MKQGKKIEKFIQIFSRCSPTCIETSARDNRHRNKWDISPINYQLPFSPELPNRIASNRLEHRDRRAWSCDSPPSFSFPLLSSISRDFGRAIRSIYGERLDGNEAASRRIGVTDFRYGSNTCNSWRLSSRMVCASKNVESIFSPPIRDSLLSLIIPRPRYS